MKTFIALLILFAVVINCQAEYYIMRATVTQTGHEKIRGKITGDMFSNKGTHHFDFGPHLSIPESRNLVAYFQLDDVQTINFLWETESKMSLGLKPITIELDNNKSEKYLATYLPEKVEISNGETVTFRKK